MTGLIIFISFLLHVITISAIVLLLKQIKQLHTNVSSEHDVAALFENYLQEVKEENMRLEKQLQVYNGPQQYHDESTKRTDQDTDILPTPVPFIHNEVDDQLETSLQAKILKLHHDGKSIETIAKELNCGKTEAELMIKLHAKKNE